MSDYLVNLLDLSIWQTVFITSFFFGLFFLLFVVLTSFGHHGPEKDLHGKDFSKDLVHESLIDSDHSLDMDHSIDTDHHPGTFDVEHDLGVDHELGHREMTHHEVLLESQDLDLEDFGTSDGNHVFASASGDVSIVQDAKHVEKSNYTLGNIAVFLFMFGQVGWLFSENLSDMVIIAALSAGFITMKVFSWILSNYAKTVIVPVFVISRGDIGTVVSDVTYEKIGIVQVTRKDGLIITIMARGAFPHDSFVRGERGYVWDHEGSFYALTHGHQEQPDLVDSRKPKKAL